MKDATAGFSLAGVGVSVTRIRETTDRVAHGLWEGVRVLGAAGARRLGMASRDEVDALRRRIVGVAHGLETLEEARSVEERRAAPGT